MENALQKLFIQSYLNQCSMRHHNDFVIDASKLKTASRCKNFFLSKLQPTQTPSVSSAGTEECGHRCVNKAMCGHDCCRNGVNKRKTPKTRPKTPQVPKHKPMDSYVSTLKDRVSQTPNIAKRLKVKCMYTTLDHAQIKNSQGVDKHLFLVLLLTHMQLGKFHNFSLSFIY